MPELKSLCAEYFKIEMPDSVDAQGNAEVNLSRVKAKVIGAPTWTTVTTPHIETQTAERVTVERNNTFKPAFGTLKMEKTFKWLTEVRLESNVIKGLTWQLSLPLDPAQKSVLGDSVNIDVTKAKSTSQPEVPIQIRSGQQFGQGARASVADVSQESLNYTGRFTCKVLLSGRVLLQMPASNSEQRIEEVVALLREKGRSVEGLVVDRTNKGVTCDLKGTVTFRVDNENIEWK